MGVFLSQGFQDFAANGDAKHPARQVGRIQLINLHMVCWIAQVNVATETEIFYHIQTSCFATHQVCRALFSRIGQPKIGLYV